MGGHYPLEIKVTDVAGRVLTEQLFKNVWDRKSKPEIMLGDGIEWDAPVNIETWEHGEHMHTETLDKVKVREPSTQMDLSTVIGEREQ